MALKAVKPEVVVPTKPKLMASGKSGVGKTMWALGFPTPYVIDTEGGAVRDQYVAKLKEMGGAYFGKAQGSQDFNTVMDEIKTLATTKHDYKTLIIDSFSHLYNTAASIAEEKIGNEFGRDKKEANRPTRQLIRWLEQIDMTVILICHQREKWERRGKDIVNVGTTFDGYDKLEYILDLWVEIQKTGTARVLVVKKSRIEAFPEGKEMPLDYKGFAELYGQDIIEKEASPVVMATVEQVDRLNALIEAVKVDQEVIDKWMTKANVETFGEMKGAEIGGCIAFLEKKLATVAAPAHLAVPENGKKTPVAAGRK